MPPRNLEGFRSIQHAFIISVWSYYSDPHAVHYFAKMTNVTLPQCDSRHDVLRRDPRTRCTVLTTAVHVCSNTLSSSRWIASGCKNKGFLAHVLPLSFENI